MFIIQAGSLFCSRLRFAAVAGCIACVAVTAGTGALTLAGLRGPPVHATAAKESL